MKPGNEGPKQKTTGQAVNVWELQLYVAGQTRNSLRAYANLKQICEDYLKGRYRIVVIDLLQNPRLARKDQVLAVPTLVRKLPPPGRKIIGDLSNTECVLVGLELRPPGWGVKKR